ncbi:glycosyltransferase, partial [Flavobacteriales bacterium]|nr:glycosyltransferase [Flavobacteriales bacterium]
MTTSVVILNWNGVHHLKTYLPSVIESAQSDSYNVFVIDNGSTDNSVAWLNENFKEVKVIELDENYGFAGGYNRGLTQIISDRFVLLNSDVRVHKGWVTSVNKSMSSNDWKASAPLILDDETPELYEYAGAAGGYIDKDGFMFCAGRVFDYFEKADNKYRA